MKKMQLIIFVLIAFITIINSENANVKEYLYIDKIRFPVFNIGDKIIIHEYGYHENDYAQFSLNYGNRNNYINISNNLISFYIKYFNDIKIEYQYKFRDCNGNVYYFYNDKYVVVMTLNNTIACHQVSWFSQRKKYYEKIYVKDMPLKDIYSEKGNEIYRLINEKIEYDAMKLYYRNESNELYASSTPLILGFTIMERSGNFFKTTLGNDSLPFVLRTKKRANVSSYPGIVIYHYPTSLAKKIRHLKNGSPITVNHFVRDDHYNKRWVKIGEGQFIMEDGITYENQKEIDAADREYEEILRKRDQK